MYQPLARIEGLLIQNLEDKTIVYDLMESYATCLDPTAAKIWTHCDGQTLVSEIVNRLNKSSFDTNKKLVLVVLDQLEKQGLLIKKNSKSSLQTEFQSRGISIPTVF